MALQDKNRRRKELAQQQTATAEKESRVAEGLRPDASTPSAGTVAAQQREEALKGATADAEAKAGAVGKTQQQLGDEAAARSIKEREAADTAAAGISTGSDVEPPQADNITRGEVAKTDKTEPPPEADKPDFQPEVDRLNKTIKDLEERLGFLATAGTVKPEQSEAVETARKLQEDINKRQEAFTESAATRGVVPGTPAGNFQTTDSLTLGSIFGGSEALTPEQQVILGQQLQAAQNFAQSTKGQATNFASLISNITNAQASRVMDKLDPDRMSGLEEKTEAFVRAPFESSLNKLDISNAQDKANLNYHESIAEASMQRAISDRERENARNDARAQGMAARLGVAGTTTNQIGQMTLHQDGQRAVEDLLGQRAATQKYYADTKINISREYNNNYQSIKTSEQQAVTQAWDGYIDRLQNIERLGLDDMNEIRKEINDADKEYLGNWNTITTNALDLIDKNKNDTIEFTQRSMEINKDMSALQGHYIDGNGNILLDDDGNAMQVPETSAKVVHWSTDNDGILYGVDENGEVQDFGAIGKASKKSGTGGISGTAVTNPLDKFIDDVAGKIMRREISEQAGQTQLETALDNLPTKQKNALSAASKLKLSQKVREPVFTGEVQLPGLKDVFGALVSGQLQQLTPELVKKPPDIDVTEVEFKKRLGLKTIGEELGDALAEGLGTIFKE